MEIHWHEGLFLQPHHLQQLQRSVQISVASERRVGWAYAYGLIEARLSEDDLENLRIRFDKLHAVMPSGNVVRFPENAELPALDIKPLLEASGQAVISLALPLWSEARSNAIAPDGTTDARSKILYQVVETEVSDENTGENPKPFLYRRFNARLISGDDDTADLEVIPLLQISRGVGEDVGRARRETTYVGPCLLLRGSSSLRTLVRDISNQVLASRQELVIQINRGGFSIETLRGLQLEQLFRLRTLNHYGARLESLVQAPNVTPFDMYLELRELLGELAALHPDRDLWEVAPYNHDAPYPCFEEVAIRIRQLLKGTVAPSFRRVLFGGPPGALRAAFTDEDFSDVHEYFLGIRTKEEPRDLARLVEDPDRFKLMPESAAERAIRGVSLVEERFPPLELPAQSNLHYFRVLRGENARSWRQIETEKAAVIRWPHRAKDDYDCTLYLTSNRPDTPS